MNNTDTEFSPLLQKYLRVYQKNPNSRVFAPLAEAYRKMNKIPEAMKILEQGMVQHPTYVMGHLCLAKCYFDLQQFEKVYTSVRPFVSQNLDNLSLQRLFAETCEKLGHEKEALEIYKHLLFLNPRDADSAERVKNLEERFKLLATDHISDEGFRIEKLNSVLQAFDDADDWVRMDLYPDTKEELRKQEHALGQPDHLELIDENIVENQNDREEQQELQQDEWQILDSNSSKTNDHDSVDESVPLVNELGDFIDEDVVEEPIITHTLVDLYCAQQCYDKAIEVLNKILEINPDNKLTIDKLADVKRLRDTKDHSNIHNGIEDDENGHDELMMVYDQQFPNDAELQKAKIEKLEGVFSAFLAGIHEKAKKHV